MRGILQDVRSALRRLIRSPRFTLAAVSLLGVGVGANVAVFTVLHTLLFQPLPYADPDRLVRIWESHSERGIVRSAVSRGNFADWRERVISFQAIEAFDTPRNTLVRFGSDDPEIIRFATGTKGFRTLLGVKPIVGAGAEGTRISYGFWRRRFGGDPRVVGTNFIFEGLVSSPAIVGGVMPRGFDFPLGADAWGIMLFGTDRAARNVNVIARLKPDVSLAQARAEMDVIAAALAAEHPAENGGWRVEIAPLRDAIVRDVRSTTWLVYGAVCLLLLIAVGNVAGLVLARLTVRERESAVRMVLGASMPNLLRDDLIEKMVLAGAAAMVGLGVAGATLKAMLRFAPATVPRLEEMRIGVEEIGATLVLTCAIGLFLWLLSATLGRREIAALGAGHRQVGSGQSGYMRSALMVGQITFCVALLVLASLMVRNFLALHGANNGFDPHDVFTVQLRHSIMKPGEVVKHYPTRRFTRVTEEIVNAARTLPDVVSAAGVWYAPLARPVAVKMDFRVLDGPETGPLSGWPPIAGRDVRQAAVQVVTAGYFDALRIPLLSGRPFESSDRLREAEIDDRDAPRGTGVALVSSSLARREWPDGKALGRYLALPLASYRSVEVIGVVGDVRMVPGTQPDPLIYLPYSQAPLSEVTVLVRTNGDTRAAADALRESLRAYGTDISAFNQQTMDDIMATALAEPRFNSAIMSWFGVGALLFTAVGLYSVLSFSVAQRTREFGVRIAIGAGRRDILAMVIRHGLGVALVGTLIGAAGAQLGVGVLRSVFAEIQPIDAWLYVIVAVGVLAIAFVASYLPARRASRIDPVATLRME